MTVSPSSTVRREMLELVLLSPCVASMWSVLPQLVLEAPAVDLQRSAIGSSSAVGIKLLELVKLSSGAESVEMDSRQLELALPAVELQRIAVG